MISYIRINLVWLSMKDIQIMQTLLTSNERNLIDWYAYVSNMTDPVRNVTIRMLKNCQSYPPSIAVYLMTDALLSRGIFLWEIDNVRCLCIFFKNSLLKKKTRNDNTKWTLLNNVNNKLTNRKIYRKQSFYTGMLGKMLLVRTGVKLI